MKTIGKKILTGTIAAAFIIGGAGVLHITQANAAETGTSVVQNSNTSANDHGKRGGHGNNIIQEAATILGVDQTTITDQLKLGQTLVQVAQGKGITEDVLLQKLTDAENQSIDAAVTSGNLTQAQADKQKSGLADRLKKEVENSGFGSGERRGFDRGNNIANEVATILGVDQTTLNDQLKQGKTLVQVAQDKGITEDVLLQKLTDTENQSIDAAVTSGTITQAQADKQKSGLADRLKKEVENTEQNGDHGKGHFGQFADSAALAKILGITEQELTTDLQAGQSLTEIAQAKGISEDQLISQIKDNMTDTIKQFVEKKDTKDNVTPTSSATTSAATSTN